MQDAGHLYMLWIVATTKHWQVFSEKWLRHFNFKQIRLPIGVNAIITIINYAIIYLHKCKCKANARSKNLNSWDNKVSRIIYNNGK